MNAYFEREELRDELRHIYDLERLAGRIAYGSVNARELVQLKRSMQRVPAVKKLIHTIAPQFSERWFKKDAFIEELIELLDTKSSRRPTDFCYRWRNDSSRFP